MPTAIVAALLLQSTGAGEPPLRPQAEFDASTHVIRPRWLRRPSAVDLARNFPDAAMKEGLNGKGVVDCQVNAAGAMTDCRIVEAEPTGYGFDEATLKLAKLFKMSGDDADGMTTDGRRIRIPVGWRLPIASAKAVTLRYGTLVGTADVDCRSQRGRLDNCITVRTVPYSRELSAGAQEAAVKLDVSQARMRSGRVLLRLTFVP